MKNFTKYFILVFTCLLFISCSTESVITETQSIGSQSSENASIGGNTKKPTGNVCGYIEDGNSSIVTLTSETLNNLCAPNAQANVSSSSTTYKFIIDNVLTSGQWTVYSGSGITFNSNSATASGSIVTVNFAPNFTSGSIQVIGADATGQIYGPILNISKVGGGSDACNCLPTLILQPIDAGGAGTTRGQFSLEAPSPQVCSFNWANVASIKLQIGGLEFGVGTNSSAKIGANSYNNWTNTPTSPPFNNMRILTNNNTTSYVPAPGGLFTFGNSANTAIEGWATLTFKNGCSPKTIYTAFASEL